jgi:hypothetical protein
MALENPAQACACTATGTAPKPQTLQRCTTLNPCDASLQLAPLAHSFVRREQHKTKDLNPIFPTVDTLNSLQLCNNDFDRKIKVMP